MYQIKQRSNCSNHNLRTISIIGLNLIITSAIASPWIEARDPFLRSSLTLLSDAGKISSPVNHYPARWSFYGDDLDQRINTEARAVSIADQEIRHSLNSAKLNRGNRSAKFVYGNENPISGSYGQFSKDEWGAIASYEHLDNSFAFRLSTGYSKRENDKDVVWDDSYISLNSGAWLFSVGQLERWWGQGWQHNLIVSSYSKTEPDLSISYVNDNTFMGVWSVESFLAKPDDSNFDYHSATRLVSKPFSRFEYGVTYQYWYDDDNSSDSFNQWAADAKLTLPSLGSVYHSLYTEMTTSSNESERDAWLLGWSGSFEIAQHTARIVIESQQASSSDSSYHGSSGPLFGNISSSLAQIAKNSHLLDKSASAALYLQLNNDHNFSVSFQQADIDIQQYQIAQSTYRFPALSGMVHVGLGYSTTQAPQLDESQTNVWTGYEFRF